MNDIYLHEKLGLNARLTICARCGGDGDELVLLGRDNYKLVCGCGAVMYGGKRADNCGSCGNSLQYAERKELGEFEKIPTMTPCRKCAEEIRKEKEEHRKVVEAGGVYFRCVECGQQGVVKESEFAAAVREAHGIPAPGLCGVEFVKCQEHGG